MLGISGGIEPIFANSYTRTTKSLYGKDAKVKCSSKKVSLTMNMPEGKKMTKKEFKTTYCK